LFPIRITSDIIGLNSKHIDYSKKHLSILDEFAIDIASVINKFFSYAIVGGYVSILFGRSRGTEDIDFIIRPRNALENAIIYLFEEIEKYNFWSINCSNAVYALRECIPSKIRIRLARKNMVIPNAELKIAESKLDYESIEKRLKITINKNRQLYIGPLELNIAYKFYLGSQKDIEDAVHLFCLFKEIINKNAIQNYVSQLGLKVNINEFLKC